MYQHTIEAQATRNAGRVNGVVIAELDLTPHGLSDAPARQEDLESIVYIGNS